MTGPLAHYFEDLIEEVTSLVSHITGVQFGPKQRPMVQARLTKRMLDLNYPDPRDYLNYLKNNYEVEKKNLVSLLTTHYTYFFREFSQFEDLKEKGLSHLLNSLQKEGRTTLRIWSAACSRGQEVYSLAMFLATHLKMSAPGIGFEILGTDVDEESIRLAKNAVYRWEDLKEVPQAYLSHYWARGKGEYSAFVEAKYPIRFPCRFDVMNLMDLGKLAGQTFDMIFCRNVFIYFGRTQIATLTRKMLEHLSPQGLFFVGLNENLIEMHLPLAPFGPSIYLHRPKEDLQIMTTPAPVVAATPSLVPTFSKDKGKTRCRVICVDDSPTVLNLLGNILAKEYGFEVVGTAENGLEAAKMIRNNQADVMTLDIHMPQQNGIEYLKRNFSSSHPPVVIISSVSREDVEFGLTALEHGATDYVEKPSLENFHQKADEIRAKLHCAMEFHREKKGLSLLDLEKSFKRTFTYPPQDKLRVIVAGIGDIRKVDHLLKFMSHFPSRPATIVLFQAPDNFLPELGKRLKKYPYLNPVSLDGSPEFPHQFTPGQLYWGDVRKNFERFRNLSTQQKVHFLVLGGGQLPWLLLGLKNFHHVQLFFEEPSDAARTTSLLRLAHPHKEICPYTGLIYLSEKTYFGEK